MYYCFYCHLFWDEKGTPHPHTPSSFPYIFSLKKNLGHMPQRNAKCFNSFAPFLSGCHLQGLSLCPEVICSGWTIKAIMVAACFPIMNRDDWQQRDSVGVEGHLASIYLIWKHFSFIGIHSTNKIQTNWSHYLHEIFFKLKTSYLNLHIMFFNYLSHLSELKRLWARVTWCSTANASNVTEYWGAWQPVMCSN